MKHPETRNPFFQALWLCFAGVLVFLAISAGFLSPGIAGNRPSSGPTYPTQMVRALLQLDPQLGRSILRQGIPLLCRQESVEDPETFWRTNALDLFLQWSLGVRYSSPQELLRVQIPLTEWRMVYREESPVNPALPVVREEVELKPEPRSPLPAAVFPDGRPQVLIYHTHTSECYLSASGLEHRLNQRGDIVTVGRRLTSALEKAGVPAIHCEVIHDGYPFRESYQRSQKTIINLLQTYPSLRIVIDLHRDGSVGIERKSPLREDHAAKIAFVVGSDRMGLSHPRWRKNYQFAAGLADMLNRHHPGLVNRVIVSNARYNQHLHNHAIIVEIGDENSRLEDAELSADYLAETIREYLERYPASSGNRTDGRTDSERLPAVEAVVLPSPSAR